MIGWAVRDADSLADAIAPAALWTPVATLAAVLVVRAADGDRRAGAVAVAARGLSPGAQPRRLAAVGDRAADGRRPQLPVPDLRQPADAVVAAAARREGRPGHRDLDGAADARSSPSSRTAPSWPTTPWSRPTSWAAAGSTSRRRRSASARSSATPASPSRAGGCPTTGWSRCCRATPHKAKAGSSWLGSPPVRLRRQPTAADVLRTFHPSLRLKMLRALVETCRMHPADRHVRDRRRRARSRCSGWRSNSAGLWSALASGVVLLAAGAVAGGIAVRREMACGRPYPGDRAPAVVVVRVAQRGVGHVRRDGRGAVVRPRRQRHPGDEPVAARARRLDRPRRLV